MPSKWDELKKEYYHDPNSPIIIEGDKMQQDIKWVKECLSDHCDTTSCLDEDNEDGCPYDPQLEPSDCLVNTIKEVIGFE